MKSTAGEAGSRWVCRRSWWPSAGANRTTSFVFNYTFTADDKALGKVNFQAVATIQGARDAVLADNTFISLPTKVNG